MPFLSNFKWAPLHVVSKSFTFSTYKMKGKKVAKNLWNIEAVTSEVWSSFLWILLASLQPLKFIPPAPYVNWVSSEFKSHKKKKNFSILKHSCELNRHVFSCVQTLAYIMVWTVLKGQCHVWKHSYNHTKCDWKGYWTDSLSGCSRSEEHPCPTPSVDICLASSLNWPGHN